MPSWEVIQRICVLLLMQRCVIRHAPLGVELHALTLNGLLWERHMRAGPFQCGNLLKVVCLDFYLGSRGQSCSLVIKWLLMSPLKDLNL